MSKVIIDSPEILYFKIYYMERLLFPDRFLQQITEASSVLKTSEKIRNCTLIRFSQTFMISLVLYLVLVARFFESLQTELAGIAPPAGLFPALIA